MKAALVLYRRELALAWGGGGGPLLACGFLLALTAAFPLALGPDARVLAPAASGLAWIALALASLLSLERMFERDFEDGALDLLALGPLATEAVVALKALAHWTATGLPLALSAPVAALLLGQPPALLPLTALTALTGALAFSFSGALGAALALGARRGGLLIAVIVLPLFAPPVVFGTGALARAAQGSAFGPPLALLGACALFAAVIAVLAGAAAIRSALD